jgi:hypothetical protein
MPLTVVAWCAAWVLAGLAGADVVRRLGYDPRTWSVIGAVAGPLVLAIWAIRRTRRHPGVEVLEPGRPAPGDVDLLVVPVRGPTPELVRALSELRGARRRVTVARVVAFDAPRLDVERCRVDLRGAPDALGLPGAALVLLFGSPARAVEAYAQEAGVDVVLVDADAADLVGRIGVARVLTPDDVPPAERRRSVRVLELTRPVARVVSLADDGATSPAPRMATDERRT